MGGRGGKSGFYSTKTLDPRAKKTVIETYYRKSGIMGSHYGDSVMQATAGKDGEINFDYAEAHFKNKFDKANTQDICLPDFTTYSFPQFLHISMLPSGRTVFVLHAFCCSFLLSALHSGQYQARGPPKKEAPHSRQVRVRTTLPRLISAAHEGHI